MSAQSAIQAPGETEQGSERLNENHHPDIVPRASNSGENLNID